MFKINGSTISITRGDTGVFSLDVKTASGTAYDYSQDTVLFTVKKTVFDSTPLIQKQVIYEENITILPTDTSNLPYGTYVYDVQLTTAGGVVDTIITPSKFIIGEEVTWQTS